MVYVRKMFVKIGQMVQKLKGRIITQKHKQYYVIKRLLLSF